MCRRRSTLTSPFGATDVPPSSQKQHHWAIQMPCARFGAPLGGALGGEQTAM
jgi:hypothetical protein